MLEGTDMFSLGMDVLSTFSVFRLADSLFGKHGGETSNLDQTYVINLY